MLVLELVIDFGVDNFLFVLVVVIAVGHWGLSLVLSFVLMLVTGVCLSHRCWSLWLMYLQ